MSARAVTRWRPTRRWRPTGLRPRLVLAFALTTVAAASAAAGAGHASARAALLDEVQQRAVAELQRRVGEVATDLAHPPDQAALDRLRAALGPSAQVTYRGLTSAAGPDLGAVTPDLRAAVGERGAVVLERVTTPGGPRLVIGTPVLETLLDGTRRPSGVELFVVRDLTATERQVGASARAALLTSALALPPAALVALLAAGGVLRPVRELRGTARRLAEGDLSARLRVRGSDELAELAETFNAMAARLQGTVSELRRMEADARRFVADVSHELRTPLTTLTAVTEVLEADAGRMEPDARASTLLAVEETRRLARLVEDLVEVSRFDSGQAALRLERVDLARAVDACLGSRGWRDRVEVEVSGEGSALLDRRRLDVVVANLVGNALRHGAPPVRVSVLGEPRGVRIEVVDHGPGLPADEPSRVFGRFYKADAARARSEGSGLGLAIALQNARLHGGDVEAGNAPGGGARFVVRLPAREEEP
ncbi:HAMP domain-containing sensor histidine kinase [Catellatospora bangladeshensis]